MNRKQLEDILEKHKKWLRDEDGGERAALRNAGLQCANLRNANLWNANLQDADLQDADLWNADLRRAYLRNADLQGVVSDAGTSFFAIQCPEKGSFTAFKKAGEYVVELAVPEDAKRSSATSRKCRCNKATVVQIRNTDGTLANITEIASNYDADFVYKVGENVEVSDFNEDRWKECSAGIHFFITFDEAKNY